MYGNPSRIPGLFWSSNLQHKHTLSCFSFQSNTSTPAFNLNSPMSCLLELACFQPEMGPAQLYQRAEVKSSVGGGTQVIERGKIILSKKLLPLGEKKHECSFSVACESCCFCSFGA